MSTDNGWMGGWIFLHFTSLSIKQQLVCSRVKQENIVQQRVQYFTLKYSGVEEYRSMNLKYQWGNELHVFYFLNSKLECVLCCIFMNKIYYSLLSYEPLCLRITGQKHKTPTWIRFTSLRLQFRRTTTVVKTWQTMRSFDSLPPVSVISFFTGSTGTLIHNTRERVKSIPPPPILSRDLFRMTAWHYF